MDRGVSEFVILILVSVVQKLGKRGPGEINILKAKNRGYTRGVETSVFLNRLSLVLHLRQIIQTPILTTGRFPMSF